MTESKFTKILKKGISIVLTLVMVFLSTASVSHAEEISTKKEFQAVWISYLEFNDRLKDPVTGELGFTKERFEATIDEMFDQVLALKMNAVVVQIRPFGDAMYPSKYFPWSKYISGTQGVDPGFDSLDYMVSAAHERDLEFHAWINPYRVTGNPTDVTMLSENNPARRCLTNENTLDDRNVLTFNGALYYNPSDLWSQNLIRNGVKEIVENYDVDGIHFDDYFYPNLGADYKKNFDYNEYKEYYDRCKENNIKTKSIADWRRNNVNTLVKNVYKAIKSIDETVEFGISPGGYLDNFKLDDRYYLDIKTWLSKEGYIDYICPQLYWTFSHSVYPFDKTLERWLSLRTNPKVKMYVGIATYRAGTNLESDWKKDSNILKNMTEYGRGTGSVDGYLYFRYDYFYHNATQKAVEKLLELL